MFISQYVHFTVWELQIIQISFSRGLKKLTLARPVLYCVPVLSSKLIGIKVFAFNPYFCIKYIPFPQELNIDSSWVLNTKVDFRLISKKGIFYVYFSDINLQTCGKRALKKLQHEINSLPLSSYPFTKWSQ